MEIRDLRYFRAVVEAGSLTRAATLLHMTPGALSKALQRLERDIGQPLFTRAGRSLSVNQPGSLLYRRSAQLIEEHANLVHDLSVMRSRTSSTLRMASFEVFTTYCLAEVLARFRSDTPVQVLDVGVGEIEAAVKAREVDLGISYIPAPDRDLHFRKVTRIGFGIYGRAARYRDTPSDELPFAIPTTRLQLAAGERLGIDCWPYERVPRTVKYRLTLLQTALELARAGLCVVFIPDFVAALYNRTIRRSQRLTRFPEPAGMKPVQQEVYLITRMDESEQSSVIEFARQLKEVLRASDGPFSSDSGATARRRSRSAR